MSDKITEEVAVDGTEMKGLLGQSLQRSTNDIRKDRALMIYEDLEREYDRKIDDLDRDIRRKESNQNREFDFSPGTTIQLTLSDNFDPLNVLEQDFGTSLEIREMKIKRNLYAERYNVLFGSKYDMLEVN